MNSEELKVKNEIPDGWKMTTLGEVAEINPTESLKVGCKAKYVAMEAISSFTRKISKFAIKGFSGGMKFKNGDTLFARITPCLENGKTAYVDILESDEVGFGSTEYIVIREIENKSDKKFLYYISISPRFRELAIKTMTGTSGRQRVQTDQLVNEPIVFPKYPEQRAIAGVLSSLDDKIELLREQNKTLEATAQAIFKEWFVKFNFPVEFGVNSEELRVNSEELRVNSEKLKMNSVKLKTNSEGKTRKNIGYKDAGGKMIDSELGQIPEGWRVERIKNVVSENTRGIAPVYAESGIPVINQRCIRNGTIIEEAIKYHNNSEKQVADWAYLKPNDILINSMGVGTLGRISQVFLKREKDYLVHSCITILRANEEIIVPIILGYYFKSIESKIESMGTGTTGQTSLNNTLLGGLKLVVPDKKIQGKLLPTFKSIALKIDLNYLEVQTLSSIRNLLLPKLMKGKIRVKGFEN